MYKHSQYVPLPTVKRTLPLPANTDVDNSHYSGGDVKEATSSDKMYDDGDAEISA